jgi:coenzyme F420 hydrogenase subunit beta
VRRLWEGHSTDEEIRFRGSSGGAITALALYGLEAGGLEGVLHTAASTEDPIRNETVMSRSRDELLRTAGSRYSPASPCERLDLIEQSAGQSMFIGKPCDVTAVNNICRIRPGLAEKVGLTVALFCAGTPSTNGTKKILEEMGLDPATRLESFHYRGQGWPGRATAVPTSGDSRSLSYEESWGAILTRHVQWRCRLCADHTGEFADVAVGDPWYRPPQDGEPGRSLIVARTRRGEEFVRAAIQGGFLSAEEREPQILVASQPNLLKTRGAVWGRRLGCRLTGAGVPQYARLPTFPFWLSELSFGEKVRSILGTIRRIILRRYLPSLFPSRRRPQTMTGEDRREQERDDDSGNRAREN